MARIPRSEQFRQEWQEILTCGIKGEGEGLLDALVRTGARYMLQVAIEEEVTEFLGREHYQRGERIRQGYRNGYEPKRLVTGQGVIEVGIPQVRNTDEPFHSELLTKRGPGRVSGTPRPSPGPPQGYGNHQLD